MSNSPKQFTRREALKRGAVIGGTVLWVTPVVQTLGMSRAFAQTPSDVCVPGWSDQVESYMQGIRNDGTAILAGRDDPLKALGAPDVKFVSLGYGGTLIVRLETPYYSGKLGEAVVIETTFGAPDYPTEKANVSVSGDAAGPWVSIGVAFNDVSPDFAKTEIPLDTVVGLPAIVRYVKLVDDTDSSLHNGISDGFDVDAVGISCP